MATTTGSWDNPSWVEKYDWACTSTQHIWYCVDTELYHFSDEASQFDIHGYDNVEDCLVALNEYAARL